MTTTSVSPDRRHARGLRARAIRLAERLYWLHTTLGLVGNVSFVIGSVFFLFESLKTAGVWLFVVGSVGMLLGSIGQKVVQWEDRGDG